MFSAFDPCIKRGTKAKQNGATWGSRYFSVGQHHGCLGQEHFGLAGFEVPFGLVVLELPFEMLI